MRFPACLLAVLVTSSFARAQAPVGSDDCATAAVLVGDDISVPYYNGTATTGPHGQFNSACTLNGQTGIAQDLWFTWTAPFAGRFVLSTCGATLVDTKLALYDVAALSGGCPSIGVSSPVVACNDDISQLVRQARIVFNAIAGKTYLIQLGSFPSTPVVGGSGVLTLRAFNTVPDPSPCVHDDGNADGRSSFYPPNGGEEGILQTFGRPGTVTDLHGVWLTYGAAFAAGNTALTDGTPVNVFVYDDPNDDGNPIDGQLIAIMNETIKLHDTDVFNFVRLPAPFSIDGVYYIGWSIFVPGLTHPGNLAPFGYDLEDCDTLPGEAWAMWNTGGQQLDFVTLGNNARPPFNAPFVQGENGANFTWMIRPGCTPVGGQSFCASDTLGIDHTTPCPCGNTGAVGNGCAHSFSASGAHIETTGMVEQDNVALHASNMPATSFTLFMQHANSGDSIFHDGVLCAGNPLIRLRGGAAVAGAARFPTQPPPLAQTLSQRGGTSPGSGATMRYAAWYRNASSTFCPPQTSNVTNGWIVTW